MALFANWDWFVDGWIIAAVVLSAMACALLGNYLVLRRMAMMGDALSHAVLPGIALAFVLTGSRNSVIMLAGAAAVGVLAAVLIELVAKSGKVENSASMGVVFTALFAVGLIMIERWAHNVDLDPGCVLYGEVVAVVVNDDTVWGAPPVVWKLVGMLALNLLFVGVFYKELKITAFDPALATTLGINATLMHYLLMILVAATTVASFEVVGSVLVVAMLVVPPATAYLLTRRLGTMIVLSLAIAALAGVLGHIGAGVPKLFGLRATNTPGAMAVVAGVLFLLAMLFAPQTGLVARLRHRGAVEQPAEAA